MVGVGAVVGLGVEVVVEVGVGVVVGVVVGVEVVAVVVVGIMVVVVVVVGVGVGVVVGVVKRALVQPTTRTQSNYVVWTKKHGIKFGTDDLVFAQASAGEHGKVYKRTTTTTYEEVIRCV